MSRRKYQIKEYHITCYVADVYCMLLSIVDNCYVTCNTCMYRLNPGWVQEPVGKFLRQISFVSTGIQAPERTARIIVAMPTIMPRLTKPWNTVEIKSHMLSSRIRVISLADTARKLLEHGDGWNSNADLVHMMLSTKADLPTNFRDVLAHGHFAHLL